MVRRFAADRLEQRAIYARERLPYGVDTLQALGATASHADGRGVVIESPRDPSEQPVDVVLETMPPILVGSVEIYPGIL